jgi:uncharacterized protein YjiS (DUF1127 family)
MTTTSTMPAPDYGCDFGTGLRRHNRFLDGAAQFAKACVRIAARVAQAIARKHRMRRDMRQLMSMSEHRLRDIGLSRAEIGGAVAFYVHR